MMFHARDAGVLAVPLMSVVIAAIVGLPLTNILNDVIAAGAVRLAPAYVAVFAGRCWGG